MKLFYFSVLVLTVVIGCRRTERGDVSGSEEINGKVYLVNPYDTFPAKPLGNQIVLLQRKTDFTSNSYIMSTMTNTSGEFLFKYLDKDSTFKLHSEIRTSTRIDNDILYTADTEALLGKSFVLNLKPDTLTQNGLFFICTDAFTTPGPMPRDSIYVYTSENLAAADSGAVTGNGSSYRFQANVDGKALKMNLPFNIPLYVNTACTYGNKRFRSKYSIKQLRRTGIDTLFVRLTPL